MDREAILKSTTASAHLRRSRRQLSLTHYPTQRQVDLLIVSLVHVPLRHGRLRRSLYLGIDSFNDADSTELALGLVFGAAFSPACGRSKTTDAARYGGAASRRWRRPIWPRPE